MNAVIPSLQAHDVGFSYGSDTVLEGVDLEVRPGEFVALVGPNGSGKTTLLRVLLGLLTPRKGSVALFGQTPGRLRDRWRLGYVPQRRDLSSDVPATVREVVMAGRLGRRGWWRRPRRADREAVDHALESVALGEHAHRRIGELSGGQQQRALIAKAFAGEPELLVLDEPIAGVDADSQRLFRDALVHFVTEHGAAVLLVSHELGAVASDLDRVVVIRNRIVFDGTPAELTAEGVHLGIHREDLPLWLEGLE